jgi:quercetin dioxygenase-like cupin family protein
MCLYPPGVRHWHGATATTPMSHVAIAESLDGKSVDWMEQVLSTISALPRYPPQEN